MKINLSKSCEVHYDLNWKYLESNPGIYKAESHDKRIISFGDGHVFYINTFRNVLEIPDAHWTKRNYRVAESCITFDFSK